MSTATDQPQRRATRQRQLVLDEVRSRRDHPTADAIYQAVRERDEHISKGTVYRNLHLLAETGEILSVPTPTGEHFDLRLDDHAHIVCTSCGAVADVALPQLPDLYAGAAAESGWTISGHETLFSGICPRCRG